MFIWTIGDVISILSGLFVVGVLLLIWWQS